MVDIQYIRDNAELVKQKSLEKGYPVDVDTLLNLDKERRELLAAVEALRARRNDNAGKINGGPPEQAIIDEGKQIKIELAERETYLLDIERQFMTLLKQVPNMPLADVPVGSSETENQVVYEWGEKPQFDFEPKNHAELAEKRGWLDKERAAKVTGSRFAYIKGDLVKLQFALINWVTDVLTDENRMRQIIDEAGLGGVSPKPFTPVLPPLLISTSSFEAMDRLEPQEDRYKIEGEDLWLQGSAEHVLGSMHANETFQSSDLPARYLGFATSFRKEAGTYGKDMEGIIRMHQFDKLEMESFTEAKDGINEHLFMIALQEYILKALNLPYRKLLKCTFDIGKPNARGVDMEVWLPGQSKYRETHTADYMTDYQARRLKTRTKYGDMLSHVHTNDATALALGRGMVAIIENYQNADLKVRVPDVLKNYLGGRELL
ncbi:serine--tRNA ligase [Candidatus Saccharibacteria bacterium]|nr:serine--tRNA ligase [Candidatus Saccharibacteria bacterium]